MAFIRYVYKSNDVVLCKGEKGKKINDPSQLLRVELLPPKGVKMKGKAWGLIDKVNHELRQICMEDIINDEKFFAHRHALEKFKRYLYLSDHTLTHADDFNKIQKARVADPETDPWQHPDVFINIDSVTAQYVFLRVEPRLALPNSDKKVFALERRYAEKILKTSAKLQIPVGVVFAEPVDFNEGDPEYRYYFLQSSSLEEYYIRDTNRLAERLLCSPKDIEKKEKIGNLNLRFPNQILMDLPEDHYDPRSIHSIEQTLLEPHLAACNEVENLLMNSLPAENGLTERSAVNAFFSAQPKMAQYFTEGDIKFALANRK